MNNFEVADAAWDAAERNFKDQKQSIHGICGQAVEMILKASIASRTLDNVTCVLVSFKNFKKSLKRKLNGEEKAEVQHPYKASTIQQVLQLPNRDLNENDVERPI